MKNKIKIILNQKIISLPSQKLNEEWTVVNLAEYFLTYAQTNQVTDIVTQRIQRNHFERIFPTC